MSETAEFESAIDAVVIFGLKLATKLPDSERVDFFNELIFAFSEEASDYLSNPEEY